MQLLKEMEQFGEETEKLHELKEQLVKENEQLKHKNIQLQTEQRQGESENHFDESKEKLEKKLTQLDEEKKQLVENIEKLEKEKEQLVKNIEKLEEEKGQHVKYIEKLEEGKEQLVKNIEKLEEEKEQLAKNIEKLEEEKEQIEDDLLETNEENEKFAAEIQNKNSEIYDLKKNLDSLRIQIEHNLDEMRTQTKTITEQELEIIGLTAQLKAQGGKGSENEKLITSLENERNDHLKQIVDLKRKLSDVQNELDETEFQNQTNAERIEKCNEQISHLESELKDRNIQVCGFLDLLKKVKSMKKARSSDNLINNDFIDLEDEAQDEAGNSRMSPTYSPEEPSDAFTESREILEYILQDSNNIQTDGDQKHLGKYCISGCKYFRTSIPSIN